MSENENDELIFKTTKQTAKIINKRAAIRYLRSDISVTLSKPGLFNFTKFIPVKLIDISSKGATIECDLKISLKKPVIIYLLFTDNKSFNITAKVIHLAYNSKSSSNKYGLKFDKMNNDLGDYLISSQNHFNFS